MFGKTIIMGNDIFGQWIGNITGTNSGTVIFNIDKGAEDRALIMFDDVSGNGDPMTAVSFFQRLPTDKEYHGNLSMFAFFDAKTKQQINTVGKEYPTIGDIFFSVTNGEMTGRWSTNIGTSGQFVAKRNCCENVCPVVNVVSWGKFKEFAFAYVKQGRDFYFRGHETSDYSLRTLYHRMDCWNLARYFTDSLQDLFEALGRFNNDRYNLNDGADFGAGLHLAQHHGFPTPLLDWTLSPFIASYFAFRQCKRTVHPKSVRVYCFDKHQWTLDRRETFSGFISPWALVRPLKLSLGKNQRAIAQDAVSLYSNVDNIEAVLSSNGQSKYLTYYDIDYNDCNLALQELRAMGIYEERMFPDIDAVCRVAKKTYFGKE